MLLLFALAVVFRGVAIVDVEAGKARPGVTVVVAGGRIESAGAGVPIPAGARVLDGRGKFLMPGLWDMHVHMHASLDFDADTAGADFFAPQFLANGVTGARCMGGSMNAVQKLRRTIAAPRMVATGAILDGPQPYWPGSVACGTAQEARAAVRKLKQEGAEFVKVYSGLPREAYFAIAEECRRLGLPFAGHVPNSVTAAEASAAGQKSIEHLARVDAFDVLAKNGTWVTPTLSVARPELRRERAVLPGILPQLWKEGPAGGVASGERELRLVGAMHRAGVRILAGTDTPNPWVFPGTSLHDELALLVRAGLAPAEALRAATLGPAEFLGIDAATIAPGKPADLVLLGANPLEDIANTRRIEAVMAGGELTVLPSRP